MWEQVVRVERERVLAAPPAPSPPPPLAPLPPIHYTELPEDTSGGPLSVEWNVYRREVSRLLAEGHEGRWVLIKGEEIVGIWDSEVEAQVAAVALPFPVALRRVLTWEPVRRTPLFMLRRPCRS
jgi:hypothetical protein